MTSPGGWQRILVRIDLSVKAGRAAMRDELRIQTTIQRKVELPMGKIAEALDPIDTTTALPKKKLWIWSFHRISLQVILSSMTST